MNNIDYYKLKYSKYKSKYLELKQKNLEGGLLPKKTGLVCFYIDPDKFNEKYVLYSVKETLYIRGVTEYSS